MESFGGLAMVTNVLKADGGVEEYLHAKVLLCMSNALCAAHEFDTHTAQRLAEAVTAFVYAMEREHISSAEILSMVKLVLEETGRQDAAAALGEHHRRRSLARMRTEVVEAELLELRDTESVSGATSARQWSKGRVAQEVMKAFDMERQAARAVAGRVEEKVLAMAMSRVWSGLVRQLVIYEAAATMRAEVLFSSAEADRTEAARLEVDAALV
jgi:hypothetical protein